ncbi:hypothetical protein SO802_024280 [Lithocarpus litseifolius]|uniref:Uncharacterized protein n=1 Tax=Lithocarpus litseifolius TaxID=425828 RepID=A0AAW2CB82_9ROSI
MSDEIYKADQVNQRTNKISSPIRLSTRFSPGSSSILFTLNRTSSTVHRSLLGAKTTLPLRVRIKSCPSRRFSRLPLPTTAVDSPSRGSEPPMQTFSVTDVHGVVCFLKFNNWIMRTVQVLDTWMRKTIETRQRGRYFRNPIQCKGGTAGLQTEVDKGMNDKSGGVDLGQESGVMDQELGLHCF